MARKTKPSRRRYVKKRRYIKKAKTTKVLTLRGATAAFPFPPKLKTRLRMQFTANYAHAAQGAANGNAEDIYFKLNSLYLMGPGFNYPLGTYTAPVGNTAAGLYNLLSSNNSNAGSVAPYNRYFVNRSNITMQVYNEVSTNHSVEFIIVPLLFASSSLAAIGAQTIGNHTIAEQPFAKRFSMPAVLNNTSRIFRHSISVNKLAGAKNIDQDDDSYTAVAAADPPSLGLWQIRVNNMDSSDTLRNLTFRFTLEYDVMFFDLNTINSTVPS